MTLVIGVDGGGTHTRVLIADAEAREVARAESSGAVASALAPDEAARAVAATVRLAAERGGVDLPVRGMYAGLAGAGLEASRTAVAQRLEAADLAEHVVVGTDVEAAFHDAFGLGPGILLIAGTGSIAWARNLAGEVLRVGGWGERLGDEGSGFSIGMGALRAVVRAEDGLGPDTALRVDVLEHLELEGPEALSAWTTRASKRDVAALAPLVSRAASRGDEVATGLLAAAVSELSAHVGAALERSGPWPAPPALVLWGGLIQEGGSLHEAMAEAAGRHPVSLQRRRLDPSMGAARMALAMVSGSLADA